MVNPQLATALDSLNSAITVAEKMLAKIPGSDHVDVCVSLSEDEQLRFDGKAIIVSPSDMEMEAMRLIDVRVSKRLEYVTQIPKFIADAKAHAEEGLVDKVAKACAVLHSCLTNEPTDHRSKVLAKRFRANTNKQLKAAKMQRNQLAEKMGHTRSFITKLLNDKTLSPGLRVIENVADALGIDPAELLN